MFKMMIYVKHTVIRCYFAIYICFPRKCQFYFCFDLYIYRYMYMYIYIK